MADRDDDCLELRSCSRLTMRVVEVRMMVRGGLGSGISRGAVMRRWVGQSMTKENVIFESWEMPGSSEGCGSFVGSRVEPC